MLWTRQQDDQLRKYFKSPKGRTLEEFSKSIGRTKTAVIDHAQLLKLRVRKNAASGERNAHWKGDKAGQGAKRERARRRFPLGPCKKCGKDGIDRHHKDGEPGNNAPSNVMVLCRRCHMKIDGRLANLLLLEKPKKQPPKRCSNKKCARLWKPLALGRCVACYQFWRKHGKERTPKVARRNKLNSQSKGLVYRL